MASFYGSLFFCLQAFILNLAYAQVIPNFANVGSMYGTGINSGLAGLSNFGTSLAASELQNTGIAANQIQKNLISSNFAPSLSCNSFNQGLSNFNPFNQGLSNLAASEAILQNNLAGFTPNSLIGSNFSPLSGNAGLANSFASNALLANNMGQKSFIGPNFALETPGGNPFSAVFSEIVPNLQLGDVSLTGDLPIGGTIKVCGRFPIYGMVALDGTVPSTGTAFVDTGFASQCMETGFIANQIF